MAVIQSLVDTGTAIELTLTSPVNNVDIKVNFFNQTENGVPIIQDQCMIRPLAVNKSVIDSFVVRNTNRDNYAGGSCYAEIIITQVGFPTQVLLDEQSEPIVIGNN